MILAIFGTLGSVLCLGLLIFVARTYPKKNNAVPAPAPPEDVEARGRSRSRKRKRRKYQSESSSSSSSDDDDLINFDDNRNSGKKTSKETKRKRRISGDGLARMVVKSY